MMPNCRSSSMIGGLVLLIFLFCGCSQSSVVTVTRHGGIDLDSSMVLALGNIAGDQEKEFRNELWKALKANSDFKMLKEEHGQETLTDSMLAKIARALGETNQSLVVITGGYRVNTGTETVERYGTDNKKKEYTKKTVTGRWAFHLADLTNNALSFSRELQASSYEEKEPNWLLYLIVDAIRTDPLYEDVRGKVIDAFIYELHPHEEIYNAEFFYDTDMPELQTGISHAQIGQWDKAIALFESASEKYPDNKNIHKAYYDLGIAYKWNFLFSEARENLEKAYLLNNSSKYFEEIQRLSQFEQEYIIRQTEKSQPLN